MDALIAKLEEDEGDGPLGRLRKWARDTFAHSRVEQETAQLAKAAAELRAQVRAVRPCVANACVQRP